MSDQNRNNNDEHKHFRVEDDAYDDLLNSLFSDDKKPEPKPRKTAPAQNRAVSEKPVRNTVSDSAKKPPVKKNSDFKLEIKNLDEEFNAPARKPEVKKQPTGVPRAQLYKKAEPPEKKTMRERAEIRAAHEAERTERKKPEQSKLDDTIDFLPMFSYEPKKKTAQVEPSYHNSNETKKSNAAGDAVIIKKNSLPDKKKIIAFFEQNKKAWIIIAICFACAIILSSYAISCMNDILAIHRDSENVVTINIPSETNTRDVIDILKDNKLIKHKYFCVVFAKAMAFRDDNYLAGIYYITGSMGLENMLSTFKESPVTGETVSLAFPEGYSVDQIADKLEQYGVCTKTAFYTTMRDVDFSSEYSFIAEEDNKDRRYRVLEGYMYPDTYEFYVGENAASVIRRFLDNFKSKWTDEYAAQAQKLGMSIDDVITLASIIEKEAYGADQTQDVSSVLHNRLNKPGLFPTLQCDSTTEYINEYVAKNVTDASALSKYTQYYSTKKCEGLPVGAICNPGNDSIYGALYPTSTNYYYFMHDDNKKLYLASTDAEHQANGVAALKANAAKKNSQ